MIELNGKQYQPLTTMQRNQAYRHAFAAFRTHKFGPYLCNILRVWLRDNEIIGTYTAGFSTDITKLFFPEMVPHLVGVTAWPDNEDWNAHRADVLAQCIEETNVM